MVNITANDNLKMREVNEVMNTVRGFAAEDATIIFGAVYDEEMTDDLRVTVVATGLGMATQAKQQKPQLVMSRATGTDHATPLQQVDYASLDVPAVVRRRDRAAAVEAMTQQGMDRLDIPAFLRKQAD